MFIMFNRCYEVMPMLYKRSTSWLQCIQMTSLDISMFKSILLSQIKCDHMTLAINMLNKIASPCILKRTKVSSQVSHMCYIKCHCVNKFHFKKLLTSTIISYWQLVDVTLWTSRNLHYIWYWVRPTIWSYTMLYMFTTVVVVYQVKLLIFYDVQTTNLTFIGKTWDI